MGMGMGMGMQCSAAQSSHCILRGEGGRGRFSSVVCGIWGP